MEITNRWSYSEFISVTPLKGSQNEFQITMKKDKKIDKMTFSTEHRSYLLTEALKFRNLFLEKPKEVLVINLVKFHYQVQNNRKTFWRSQSILKISVFFNYLHMFYCKINIHNASSSPTQSSHPKFMCFTFFSLHHF